MFILDIETKQDKRLIDTYTSTVKPNKTLKDPEKIKANLEAKKLDAKKGMMIDTDYADILCIGVRHIDDDATPMIFTDPADAFDMIKTEPYITFNGKSFDVPLMIKYGIKHGSRLPYKRLKEGLRKYGSYGGHFDLSEIIPPDGGKIKSLDTYLQIYLGIQKTPIDFLLASEEEVIAHCLEDLENTHKLYKLFKPLFI